MDPLAPPPPAKYLVTMEAKDMKRDQLRQVKCVDPAALFTIADVIRDLGEVPAGHLYAGVMSHMTLETFEGILSVLVGEEVVRRSGSHLLTWVGPAAPVRS